MIGKAISNNAETGSTRLQSAGQINYQEYLSIGQEEVEYGEIYEIQEKEKLRS
jgi:hypothetical protein